MKFKFNVDVSFSEHNEKVEIDGYHRKDDPDHLVAALNAYARDVLTKLQQKSGKKFRIERKWVSIEEE